MSTAPVPASTVPSSAGRAPGNGPVLACVCACTVLVMGLVAAINLAVPAIAASELHPSSAELLWIVDAYVVVFACLVIPGGAAGDRLGRKGVLLTGLLTFAAGVAVCAVAPTVTVVLVGRVVTGLGAALVLPNCVGVLVHATAPEHRGRALAAWGAVSGMGGVVGNTAGAALLAGASWRSLFAAVAPIALACALAVALIARRSSLSPRSLDPAGTALFVATTVTLLIGIIDGPEQGWTTAPVVAAFASSVVLGVAWLVVELRAEHPLLDPRLFRIPLLRSASVGMFVVFFGSFGLFFLNASLLQYGRGYSVLQAGLATVPLAVPLLLGARFVPALVARAGIPATLGAAFVTIGGGLFGLSSAIHQPYPVYATWLVVIGVGFSLALPCLTAELAAALPAEQAGVAGGLQAATRELGSALGVAVVGTVLTTSFVRHLPAVLQGLDPVPRTVAAALAVAPAQYLAVFDAFTAGAGTALRIAGSVTAIAGAVVVAGARHTGRRAFDTARTRSSTGPTAMDPRRDGYPSEPPSG